MKTFLKYLLRTLAGIILIILVYFLFAFGLSYVGTSPEKQTCDTKTEIYLATNGVHLDIILPVSAIDKAFLNKLQVPEGVRFVSFGWGDKNFYLYTPTWDDLTASNAFSAMFLQSETVMHIGLYQQKYSYWEKISVCPSQVEKLLGFVEGTFIPTDQSVFPILETALYGENHKFFEARGSYSCFRTCNTWVNEGLKVAKIKTSLWSPFDFGVLHHLPDI